MVSKDLLSQQASAQSEESWELHCILKPLLRKGEKLLLLKLNDSSESQLLGRGTFWLCVYMYSGKKELLEDREDNSELWIYIVHLDLLYRKICSEDAETADLFQEV